MKRILITMIAVVFAVQICYSQQNVKTLTILHWNDLHAHNLPYKVTKKDSVSGISTSYLLGGISNMLGYLNKYRDKNSLVLNGGDDYQGTPISTITRGYSQVPLLNLFKLDAFVIGNHEFDYGMWTLDSALRLGAPVGITGIPAHEKANFDYLSSNVYIDKEKRLIGKMPYKILTKNGIKIGILGVTALDLKTLVVPSNIADARILPSDSVITAGLKYLKNKKCDLIILLTHIGLDNDKILADKYGKDVDVIVGAHSHTPLFKPVNENGVVIVQAGSYSRWLGKLDLKVDTKKDTVLSYEGKLIETKMDSSLYDRNAEALVEKMNEPIRQEMERVIGTLAADWKKGHGGESNLGQWEADAIRNAVKADVALLNSGGIRGELNKGEIKVGSIWEISPFGNTIVTFPVKGSTLKKMISNNLKKRVSQIAEGNSSDLVIVSGLNVEFDSKKINEGNENFINSLMINGEEIDENRTYTIATNNYMGEQVKKYFGEFDEKIKLTDTKLLDRDILIKAVEEQKVINGMLEKRIIDLSGK
jgi:2',3'-cyclic-nucleotide 2'-phosphodiesterase (5'-nucleotidase family)